MADDLPRADANGVRFSVVIPAYNAAATIARALDSVLSQSYPALEVIVVDDGSGDGTDAVVAGYGAAVRYVPQTNAGPSAARNHGVALAQGEWIAFLDADDWYYPDRLKMHAELIAAHPDLDFVVGNFDYRNAGGERTHDSMSVTRLGRTLLQRVGGAGTAVIGPFEIGAYISDQFSDTRTLSVPKRTFIELGGFPTELRICEDVVFLLRLCARSARVGVTCTPGAVYLVHEHGLIRSDRLRAQTETVRALRSIGDEMAHAPGPVREAWRGLVKLAYHNLAYFLAKQGRRGAAVASAARSFAFRPAVGDLKVMASILRG